MNQVTRGNLKTCFIPHSFVGKGMLTAAVLGMLYIWELILKEMCSLRRMLIRFWPQLGMV
jgi:hypothetical protein